MVLKYQPSVRSVLMCDFRGMVVPEIVKVRPVVVVSRNRHNNQLVTVVPISTTEPLPRRVAIMSYQKTPYLVMSILLAG
ncbi:type II toxin-antitoxin system PemK/MazF family toxin [Escherichia coli]|uniref:type II toxin-antitoxin system PemK/MazF family toxin n=1 Tax=Escherichia coli TaxID=562 RepID=UPI0034583A70